MHIGKRAGLDFEPVVPVSAAHAFDQVTGDRQRSRFPLFDHVPVLVQHQPRVIQKLSRAVAEVDPASACGRDGTAMEPNEKRVFDDLHVVHWCFEQHLERGGHCLW